MYAQEDRPSVVRTTPSPVSEGPIAKATFHPRISPGEVTWWAPLHATKSWQAYEVGPPCCFIGDELQEAVHGRSNHLQSSAFDA